MTIYQILILTLVSFVLGWITRKNKYRVTFLMVTSILFMYWLQPTLSIHYLDFVLPTFSIGIIVVIWSMTTSLDVLQSFKSLLTLILIFGIIFVLAMTQYIGLSRYILPSTPPPVFWVILFIAPIVLVFFAIRQGYMVITKQILWVGFCGLILLFLIIKMPFLKLQVSRVFRQLVGQRVDLASSTDFVWLGYSYLAFRLLHTIRDKQIGRLPSMQLDEYIAYVIFFPAFALGPIDRAEHFIEELNKSRYHTSFNADLLYGGQRLFIGLFKKFVVADMLSMFSLNSISAGQALKPVGAWILLYAYAFQIYFDFSGYVDIAIGLGRLMGITLPENFNKPYRQRNLTLFWNNWHITLTEWFRTYFFYPLVRFMRSKKKISVPLIILISQLTTMVLIGLWHGVQWHFIIWGGWHGIGLFVQNRWSARHKVKVANGKQLHYRPLLNYIIGMFITFNYVALGWVWFVIPNPVEGWLFVLKLFGVT